MRGNPITGSARGVSITEAVERGQRILEDRPEPKGRDRYAGRTNRPQRGRGFGASAESRDETTNEETTNEETSRDENDGDESSRDENSENETSRNETSDEDARGA